MSLISSHNHEFRFNLKIHNQGIIKTGIVSNRDICSITKKNIYNDLSHIFNKFLLGVINGENEEWYFVDGNNFNNSIANKTNPLTYKDFRQICYYYLSNQNETDLALFATIIKINEIYSVKIKGKGTFCKSIFSACEVINAAFAQLSQSKLEKFAQDETSNLFRKSLIKTAKKLDEPLRTLYYFQKAADLGSKSQNLLIEYSDKSEDIIRSFENLILAEQGDPKSQYEVGLFYNNILNNPSMANKWIKKATDQDHTQALHHIDSHVTRNDRLRSLEIPDPVLEEYHAINSIKQTVRLDFLAKRQRLDSVPAREKSKTQEEETSRKAAAAQFDVWLELSKKNQSSPDLIRGIQCLKKAAEGGHPEAQCQLGNLHLKANDFNEGYKWTVAAIKQGSSKAKHHLDKNFSKILKAEINNGLNLIQEAAELGIPYAQQQLSRMYLEGVSLSQNNQLAYCWGEKAAKQGYAPAQSDLGLLYAEGIGTIRDFGKALEWTLKAAKQGDSCAKENFYKLKPLLNNSALLLAWQQGWNELQNLQVCKTTRQFEFNLKNIPNIMFATATIPTAYRCPITQDNIIESLTEKPEFLLAIKTNSKHGLDYFDASAMQFSIIQGDPSIEYDTKFIDFLHADSRSNNLVEFATVRKVNDSFEITIQNKTIIKTTFADVVDLVNIVHNFHVHPLDQLDTGVSVNDIAKTIFLLAHVTTDNNMALGYLSHAADLGVPHAANQLANYYIQGDGNNFFLGIKYLKQAADQKLPEAQCRLGCYYYEIEKDSKQAYKWTLKAAKQKHADAQCKLGFYYTEGIGTEKNLKKALKWTSKAASQGNIEAQNNLNRLTLATNEENDELSN